MSEIKSNQQLSTLSRQSLFSLAIAKGETIRQASKNAHVSEATGYRWSHEKRVADMATDYRLMIVRETVGKLANMGSKAANRLEALIDAMDESVALKASIAALAEVRRIADLVGDNIYKVAVEQPPDPPIDPATITPESVGVNTILNMPPDWFMTDDEKSQHRFEATKREYDDFLQRVNAEAEAMGTGIVVE